jgi:hypothetical protein
MVATLAAAAVVLVGSRVNPPGIIFGPPVDPALRSVVADAWVDVSNFPRAVDGLSHATDVPIALDSAAVEAMGYEGQPDPRPLDPATSGERIHLRNVPLGRALWDVIRGVAGVRPPVAPGYRVSRDGGSIVFGPRDDPGWHWTLRTYDVADLAADCRNWPSARTTLTLSPRDADGGLDGYEAVLSMLDDALWDGTWDGPARYQRGRFGTRVWYLAPPEVHWDVQRLLFLLRHAAAAGAEEAR